MRLCLRQQGHANLYVLQEGFWVCSEEGSRGNSTEVLRYSEKGDGGVGLKTYSRFGLKDHVFMISPTAYVLSILKIYISLNQLAEH